MWSQSSSLLHSAVLHGDKHKVCQILNENEIDVNTLDQWQRTPLFYAVLTNNQDLVEILIEAHANVELFDIHQRSLLHIATDKGHLNCLKILLSALEKIYGIKNVEGGLTTFCCVDDSGVHPFHLTAKLQNVKCLQILLKHPFLGSIDCLDKNKRTPLHWAAVHGLDKNVFYLLNHKADTSFADDQGKLPLHWAAFSPKEGSKECLQALVCIAPYHVNNQDLNGATPLHLAVSAGCEEKVETLLSNKRCLVDAVDAKNQSPLHYGCSRGFIRIVTRLIFCGAEINKQDIFGATPLHYAVMHNHSQIIEMMLRRPELKDATTLVGETPLHWAVHVGANAALVRLRSHAASLTRGNKEGQTALHIAAKKRGGFSSTIEVLLKMKAPINVIANDGSTPLHYAAKEGNMQIVKQLLKAEPSCLNLKDRTGKNVLHLAAMEGHLHLTQILIEAGLSVDCPDAYGRCCLHLASFVGCSDVLCLLLENKANVNARDNEGKTALHWASLEGHLNAVISLLNYGASSNCTDATKTRLTPLDYAVKTDKKEVIEILKSAGALTSHTIRDIAARCIQHKWRSCSLKKTLFTKKSQLVKNVQFFKHSLGGRERTFAEDRQSLRYNRDNSTMTEQVLNPLTTPYSSQEMRNVGEPEYRFRENFGSGGQIIKNDAINICVRLPQGEESAAARIAWLERTSFSIISKIRPTPEHGKNF